MADVTSLVDIVKKHLASDEMRLPSFDPIVSRLRELLAKPDYRVEEIARVIDQDPALVAELLRMANSSFFRGLSRVATVKEAFVRLGAREVTNLVTAATLRKSFHSRDPILRDLVRDLWRHSISTAVGARWIARKAHDPALAEEAFLAGLLHDAGKLLLLRVLDELRTPPGDGECASGMELSRELVLQILDTMHCAEGAALLVHWNLPDTYAEVVRSHHDPNADLTHPLLAIVRLADLASRKLGLALTPDPTISLAATAEAGALGLSEMLLAELEIALEDSEELAGSPN